MGIGVSRLSRRTNPHFSSQKWKKGCRFCSCDLCHFLPSSEISGLRCRAWAALIVPRESRWLVDHRSIRSRNLPFPQGSRRRNHSSSTWVRLTNGAKGGHQGTSQHGTPVRSLLYGSVFGIVRRTGACCALAEASGLGHEVIAFRNARRASRGNPIMRDCGLIVASHFQ
jgi:hypothetical protein